MIDDLYKEQRCRHFLLNLPAHLNFPYPPLIIMATESTFQIHVRLSPFVSPTDTLPKGYREAQVFRFEPVERCIQTKKSVIIGKEPYKEESNHFHEAKTRSISLSSCLLDNEHALLFIKQDKVCRCARSV